MLLRLGLVVVLVTFVCLSVSGHHAAPVVSRGGAGGCCHWPAAAATVPVHQIRVSRAQRNGSGTGTGREGSGTGRQGTGRDGTGRDGTGAERERERNGTGGKRNGNGTGRDGTGRDWEGMGRERNGSNGR